MKTIHKYTFGATPKEIIRKTAINAPDPTEPEWVGFVPPDDLLTVLDALWEGATSTRSDRKPNGESPQLMRAKKLRIEILAALGIKEV